MRILKTKRSVLLLLAAFTLNAAQAQEISAEQKNDAIQTIAKEIAANYVYPEKGGQIASHIQTANFKGQFEKAKSWDEFDDMVTRELRAYSHDGHLYVKHDPQIVQQLKDPSGTKSKNNVNEIHEKSASVISEAKILDGNVGYLKMPELNINKSNLSQLYEAMKKMQGTKSLIIDLRDNGGGGSEVGPVLESFFLAPGTPTLRFTQRDGNFTTDSTVAWLQEKQYDKPVFILINNKTASAAEAFAFVLQQNRRAKIVGERSAGASHMNSWYVVNDENFVSVSTAAPSIPGKDITWEQEGVQPNIKVKKGDALEIALREANR